MIYTVVLIAFDTAGVKFLFCLRKGDKWGNSCKLRLNETQGQFLLFYSK